MGKSIKVLIVEDAADDADLWALVSSSPIFRDDGSYAGTIGMHADSTERDEPEDVLSHPRAVPGVAW